MTEDVTLTTALAAWLPGEAPMITKEEGKLWPHNETALQMRDKACNNQLS